jgi:hypothetical protein
LNKQLGGALAAEYLVRVTLQLHHAPRGGGGSPPRDEVSGSLLRLTIQQPGAAQLCSLVPGCFKPVEFAQLEWA